MSSNKFKRRKKVEEKKKVRTSLFSTTTNPDEVKAEEIEQKKFEQDLAIRRQAYEEIKKLELKIKYAKDKNHELDKKFLLKKAEFSSNEEFKNAFEANKEKRNIIIHELENELKRKKDEYDLNFERGGYKFKRWFYGMGKEFSRITWLDKIGIFEGFLTVFIISILLALIFLAIDAIFSTGYF